MQYMYKEVYRVNDVNTWKHIFEQLNTSYHKFAPPVGVDVKEAVHGILQQGAVTGVLGQSCNTREKGA